MTIQRIPIVTSTDPDSVSASTGITSGELPVNVMYDKYPDGRAYVTQRAPITIQAANPTFTNKLGRGAIYWPRGGGLSNGRNISVINDTVYWNSGTGPLTAYATGITAGNSPLTLVVVGDYLVILDCIANNAWYLLAGGLPTLITDVDFPGNIAGVKLAGGGVSLDGYLFVMDTSKIIYNSAQYDPTSWNPIDFVRAEREPDKGIYLSKHHDHIVAMGSNSIEFFYDSGNPVGSPLTRRDDLSYRIGAAGTYSVYSNDRIMYFVGSEKNGQYSLYELNQFVPTVISKGPLNNFITLSGLLSNNGPFGFLVRGFSLHGRTFAFCTYCERDDNTSPILPKYTLVFDSESRMFSEYKTSIGHIDNFSIVGSISTGGDATVGNLVQFLSGEIASFNFTDNIPRDISDFTSPFFYDIPMSIVTGEIDFGTTTLKFANRLSVVGSTAAFATDLDSLNVSWSDDRYQTYSTPRQILTGTNQSLAALGSFRRRAHKIAYSGRDLVRLEAIELDVRASSYA